MYNAIAGSCAEDEANAIPAGVTLNQAYFSDSSVSGAGGGVDLYMWRNVLFFDFINGTRQQGTGTAITGFSSPTITAIGTNKIKSAYTLPASTLNTFLNSANTGQTSPYFPFLSEPEEVFLNIAMFLQVPNGLGSLVSYEILTINNGWSGTQTFNPFGATKTPNFPLQNSLAKSVDYPYFANNFLTPSAANNSNWGILGTGGLANTPASFNINLINLLDLRARTGSNPSAGEVFEISYKSVSTNTAGNQEQAFHDVEITLT